MDISRMTTAIVAIVVMVIVVVTVAVPILTGFTESSPGETGTNTQVSNPEWGIYGMEDNTTITKANISADILFNGVAPQATSIYIFTDNYCVRFTNDNDYYIQYNGTNKDVNMIEAADLSISNGILAGTVTVLNTGGGGTTMISDRLIFVMSNEAERCMTDIGYVAINSGTSDMTPFFINEDRDIYGIYIKSFPSGLYMGPYGSIQTFYVPYNQTTPPTMSLSTGMSDGDAMQITGFTTDPALGNDKIYLFVPSEYYIEVPVVPRVSGPVADMVNLVPLLLIVGLIIAAVAAFITLKSRGGGA